MCTQAGPGPALRGSVLRRGPATHDSTAAPQDGLGPAPHSSSGSILQGLCLSCSPPNSMACGHHYIHPSPVWRWLRYKVPGDKGAVSQSAFTPQKCDSRPGELCTHEPRQKQILTAWQENKCSCLIKVKTLFFLLL